MSLISRLTGLRRNPPKYAFDLGNGVKHHGAKTLAALQALGSSVVSVGDVAWVTDRGVDAECLTALAGSSAWGTKETERINGNATTVADAALRYLDLVAGAAPAASIASVNRLLLPYPGEVRRVYWHPSSDPDSTTIGTHLDLNTTPTETVVVDPAASTMATATFTATTFTAGQVLSISIDPTNTYGFSRWCVELEYPRTLV